MGYFNFFRRSHDIPSQKPPKTPEQIRDNKIREESLLKKTEIPDLTREEWAERERVRAEESRKVHERTLLEEKRLRKKLGIDMQAKQPDRLRRLEVDPEQRKEEMRIAKGIVPKREPKRDDTTQTKEEVARKDLSNRRFDILSGEIGKISDVNSPRRRALYRLWSHNLFLGDSDQSQAEQRTRDKEGVVTSIRPISDKDIKLIGRDVYERIMNPPVIRDRIVEEHPILRVKKKTDPGRKDVGARGAENRKKIASDLAAKDDRRVIDSEIKEKEEEEAQNDPMDAFL